MVGAYDVNFMYVFSCLRIHVYTRMSYGRHVNANETKRIQISLWETALTYCWCCCCCYRYCYWWWWWQWKTYAVHINVHWQINAREFRSSFFRSRFSLNSFSSCSSQVLSLSLALFHSLLIFFIFPLFLLTHPKCKSYTWLLHISLK